MGAIQILIAVSLAIASGAQESDSSQNFILSRAKRSPQFQYAQAGASAGGGGAGGYYGQFHPYIYADHSFDRPQLYRPVHSQDRIGLDMGLGYNFNMNHPPYSGGSSGFYPGNGYQGGIGFHQGAAAGGPYIQSQHQPLAQYQHQSPSSYEYNNPLSWILTPRSPAQNHHQSQAGVLVWLPLENLRQHIQLQEQIEQQKQYEQERMELMHLQQLQQQRALLEEQQAEYINHAPLDNQDALISSVSPFSIHTTFYPLHEDLTPSTVSLNHLTNFVPTHEMLEYSDLMQPQLVHQPIWAHHEGEYMSPLMIPELLGTPEAVATALAQGNIPQPPLPGQKSKQIIKKSTPRPILTKRTTTTTTTTTTTRPPTLLKEAHESKLSSSTLTPSVFQENKNEVELEKIIPK